MISTVAGSRTISHPSHVRRYPVGAEVFADGVSFRVWAPVRDKVELLLDGGDRLEMTSDGQGYFRLDVAGLAAGTLYRFGLGDAVAPAPDPASRLQPDGPDGWSMVVDPQRFRWSDREWQGVSPEGQVLYELHVGTFTPEGTLEAAIGKLPMLKDIGVTCIEMMPVNEFFGTFGWGYDGVLPFAPTRLYGAPDDLRAFVDAAHAMGIGVILDVVYNHFGARDRFADFSPDYFTDRYDNEWGPSINFDGENCRGVREFFIANTCYWIDEFHFDGLRIDATQAIKDASDEHIITALAREARRAAGGRNVYLVAENEPQDTRLVRPPSAGGSGLDTLWNDDFHHSAMVALTGRNEAYYHDHRGTAQEFVSAAKYGYLFQGQRYDWQDAPRGRAALDLPPASFVHFLQNHDQIANSGTGRRMHQLAAPAKVRALSAVLLLGPQTPMLFQGQEFAASSPFFYFADHHGQQGEHVRKGRLDFLRQFPSLSDPGFAEGMALPSAEATFMASKLDWSEHETNAETVDLHRDLLALRREMLAATNGRVDGSVLDTRAFLLRYFADRPEDERLLIVNLGTDLVVSSLPDPLLAPPDGLQWEVVWSSEDFRYGGSGVRPFDMQKRWAINADCAIFCAPVARPRATMPDSERLQAWQKAISLIA
jgi:maltooligosyltrehalose trehalohydrolase